MGKREPVVWRPMTSLEQRAALSLSPGKVRYPPGIGAKRMAKSLLWQAQQAKPKITDKQATAMWKQVHRFRRQIKDRELRALGLRAITPPCIVEQADVAKEETKA